MNHVGQRVKKILMGEGRRAIHICLRFWWRLFGHRMDCLEFLACLRVGCLCKRPNQWCIVPLCPPFLLSFNPHNDDLLAKSSNKHLNPDSTGRLLNLHQGEFLPISRVDTSLEKQKGGRDGGRGMKIEEGGNGMVAGLWHDTGAKRNTTRSANEEPNSFSESKWQDDTQTCVFVQTQKIRVRNSLLAS